MSIEIERYREINKGVVKCGFNVKITAWGLTIRDCCLMEKGNQSWISFPSRKYEVDGETKYSDYVYFEKDIKERFSKLIKEKLAEVVQVEEAPPSDIDLDNVPF